MRAFVVLLSLVGVSIGCGAGTVNIDEADAATDGGLADGNATDSGRALSKVEVQKVCERTTPFQSEPCALAVRDYCAYRQTEAECTSFEPILLEESYAFGCAWAKVVKFSELESCTVESVFGRCVAVIDMLKGCSPTCSPEYPAGVDYGITTYAAANEMMEIPCYGSELGGPIDEATVIANQIGDERKYSTCADNISPPAPKALCACTNAFCAQ